MLLAWLYAAFSSKGRRVSPCLIPPANNCCFVLLGVLEEARFFGIDSLIEHLEIAIKVMHFLYYMSAHVLFFQAISNLVLSVLDLQQLSPQNSQPAEDHSPISRKEFVRFLLATPTKSELRCQVQKYNFALISGVWW